MRAIVFGAVLLLSAFITGPILAAGSKCDSGVDKASAKKFACLCAMFAKGVGTTVAEDACGPKFLKACGKAKAKGDCSVQTSPCGDKEKEVDSAALPVCLKSPSGAFLE